MKDALQEKLASKLIKSEQEQKVSSLLAENKSLKTKAAECEAKLKTSILECGQLRKQLLNLEDNT